MSFYLRLVIGPVVVADVELFAAKDTPSGDEPPPQLNGGTGTLAYPDDVSEARTFGFASKPAQRADSAQPPTLDPVPEKDIR